MAEFAEEQIRRTLYDDDFGDNFEASAHIFPELGTSSIQINKKCVSSPNI